MDFFNTLLLISDFGTKIGNIEIDDKFCFDIKGFKQANKLSFIGQIPEFDETKNYILVNSEQAAVGTILKRPLDNFFQKKTQLNIEYHYGIVLGTTNDGSEMIIEMTKSRNINIIRKQDFLAGRFNEKQIEFYLNPSIEITREYIFERAKKFEFDNYDLLDLNCKVFVEYIILDIPTPKIKNALRKIQLQLCDLKISMLNLQLSDPDNARYYEFLKAQINDAENDKLRLSERINLNSELKNKL